MPGVVVDEGVVSAVVDHAVIDDLSDVVRVLQEAMDLRVAQRLTFVLPRLPALQSSLGKEIGQGRDADVAGGVGAVRPGDVLGTLRVEHDALDLDAFDAGKGVEIADRSDAVGTTASGLLLHPLHRLGGDVRGVVLVHRSRHGALESAGGGVVEAFGDRLQLRAGLLDGKEERRVIRGVACQAVELVHDDIPDLVGLDVLEHRLESRAVGGARRLARVGELLDDVGAELVCVTGAVFTLRGQRVPFRFPVLPGLTRGRDTQVDHGALHPSRSYFGHLVGRRESDGLGNKLIFHEGCPPFCLMEGGFPRFPLEVALGR